MAVLPPRSDNPEFPFPKIMLAPVAGFTDRAHREIAREKGCRLTFSELISARGLREGSANTYKMLDECRGEHPLVVQVFGGEPDIIYEAVRRVDDLGVDGVNLNLGCPVKKVFKNKSGCGLTIFPSNLVYVIRAMRKATDKHLSVKIRAGVKHQALNYRMIGDIAQGEGCDAIIMHARTRLMGFGGQARWDWIADLKHYLDIPVIGNGDVVDAESGRCMLAATGCDGVMIARGAYGNPWVFKEIEDYLTTGIIPPRPSVNERFDTMVKHLQLAVEWKGERGGLLEMRKQTPWYIKGLPNVRQLRERMMKIEKLNELLQTFNEWRDREHERLERINEQWLQTPPEPVPV